MLIFLRASLILLTISLASCGTAIPDFPEVWQCQYNGNPRAFYCVNTKTKEQKKILANDAVMKAAQCISADDYKKSQDWIATVEQIAQQRCH